MVKSPQIWVGVYPEQYRVLPTEGAREKAEAEMEAWLARITAATRKGE